MILNFSEVQDMAKSRFANLLIDLETAVDIRCESLKEGLNEFETEISQEQLSRFNLLCLKENLKMMRDSAIIGTFDKLVNQYLKEKDRYEANRIYKFEQTYKQIKNFKIFFFLVKSKTNMTPK